MTQEFKRKPVPYCAACWDKGWSSVLAVEKMGADFDFHGSTKIIQKRNYCQCKKGQKLLKENL